VTIPNSFTAGNTAKASEVNDNFTAVKTAVDGNAADITTNATAISNKVASVTGEGGLSASSAGNDVTIKRANGYVSIDSYALHSGHDYSTNNTHSSCGLIHISSFLYFLPSETEIDTCKGVTGVNFPDGATIKKLTCRLTRNHADGTPTVKLMRYAMDNDESPATYGMASVTAESNSTEIQILEDDTIFTGTTVVDNQNYSYGLVFEGGGKTSTDGSKVRFHNCAIGYEY
jgi:hypothetical protein